MKPCLGRGEASLIYCGLLSFANMHGHHVHVILWRAEEGIGCPGTGVPDGPEPPSVSWNQSWALWKSSWCYSLLKHFSRPLVVYFQTTLHIRLTKVTDCFSFTQFALLYVLFLCAQNHHLLKNLKPQKSPFVPTHKLTFWDTSHSFGWTLFSTELP